MQTRFRKHVWLYVTAAVLIAVLSVSLYYQFGYLSQKQTEPSPQVPVASAVDQNGTPSPSPEIGGAAGGPMIFATLSFSNETGFVTTVHPTSGTTEFVLPPNSVGEFSVTYTGIGHNNLSTSFFSVTGPVSVLNVLSNGTLATGSGLSVTESSASSVSSYQVVVTYTVTSAGTDGLYVLVLPSTVLNTIIDVGTQPYTGPLTWLNGIIN